MINVSIADNQPVVMQGISCYFKNHTEILINDTVFNVDDIEISLKSQRTNVLVIDIELEGLHSITSLKKIIKENPITKILIYTCASEKLFGVTSLKAGAAGFISKNTSLSTLENAIRVIADGQTMFSDFVHKSILATATANNSGRMYKKLSAREKEVLNFLISGKKNNEISELLHLNEKTVSTYKLRLLNKLGVTNIIDLINKAKNLEIV